MPACGLNAPNSLRNCVSASGDLAPIGSVDLAGLFNVDAAVFDNLQLGLDILDNVKDMIPVPARLHPFGEILRCLSRFEQQGNQAASLAEWTSGGGV